MNHILVLTSYSCKGSFQIICLQIDIPHPFEKFFVVLSFFCKICKLPFHHFATGRSAFCITFQRKIAKLLNVVLHLYSRSIVCKSPSQIIQHCYSKICISLLHHIFAFAIFHCEPILLFAKFHSRSFLRKIRQACSPLNQLFFGFASDIDQTNVNRDIRDGNWLSI